MLVSVLIYIFVIPRYVGENINMQLPAEAYQMLRSVLYIVSVGLILGARFVSKFLLSGKKKLLQDPRATSHPALQRYMNAMIIALGMSEAVAIFGLVLFITARDTVSLYFLGAVSILSMLMYRPSRDDTVEAARNREP